VSGDARVSGDAQVIVLTGLDWVITVTDAHIQIGCQCHTIDAWNAFSDDEIESMASNALEFWKKHKTTIMALARR
jgi:hypothetical protein